MTENNVEFGLQKVNYSLRACKSYLLNLILKLTPCTADLKCRAKNAKTVHGKLETNLFFQEIIKPTKFRSKTLSVSLFGSLELNLLLRVFF